MLTDEERQEIATSMGVEDYSWVNAYAERVERAVLAKAMPIPKQEPIYMWRLEDDGWMECTKEWFDAAISSGYEKRIVYAEPQPAQAAAIPDRIITGVLSAILIGRREPMAPHNVAALREHLGERTDEELTFYIQNGRWPLSSPPNPE